MTVRTFMNINPVTLDSATRLKDAQDLMHAHSVRHLPVVDTGDVFVGIVQDHDIRVEVRKHGEEALNRAVLNIIVLGTPTLEGNDSIDDAWALLSRSPGYNPVPVVDAGKLVGTISQHQLLRAQAGLPPSDESSSRSVSPFLSEWAARAAPLVPQVPAPKRPTDGGQIQSAD